MAGRVLAVQEALVQDLALEAQAQEEQEPEDLVLEELELEELELEELGDLVLVVQAVDLAGQERAMDPVALGELAMEQALVQVSP